MKGKTWNYSHQDLSLIEDDDPRLKAQVVEVHRDFQRFQYKKSRKITGFPVSNFEMD